MKLPEQIVKELAANPTSLYDAMTEEDFIYIKDKLVGEFPQVNNIEYGNKAGLLELLAKAMKKDAGLLKANLKRELMIWSLKKVWKNYLILNQVSMTETL